MKLNTTWINENLRASAPKLVRARMVSMEDFNLGERYPDPSARGIEADDATSSTPRE
jgi:hypothetical protein